MKVTTLGEFVIERQSDFPFATGELTRLLSDISIAAKIVNREVNKAGLVDILGAQGSENMSGEAQQKLDVYANNQFMNALMAGGEVCGFASEEEDARRVVDQRGHGRSALSSSRTSSGRPPRPSTSRSACRAAGTRGSR